MRIVGVYPFNDPNRVVETKYAGLVSEVYQVIAGVDAFKHHNKISTEKTMPGKELFSPTSMNEAFDVGFGTLGWKKVRVPCEYPTQFYVDNYQPPKISRGAFREIDFVKQRVGVEVQFGKYSFMVYNVAAKMTIFRNMNIIEVGIEIVPVKELAEEMSSGVSYFEQFLWDLEQRGTSNIDVPVLVLGITA
jgi:hypothetical protein